MCRLFAIFMWACFVFSGDLSFSNQTQASGVAGMHQTSEDMMGYVMFGGGAVADFNGDGWPDIFFIGGGLQPDRLFINQMDGTFEDQANLWGLTLLHRGIGASSGDFDHDGDMDLFVTSLGPAGFAPTTGQHRLLRNDGSVFTDIAVSFGVATTSPVIPDGFGSSFGDFDLDGDLDLVVMGWQSGSQGNVLFRNDGHAFSNVTAGSGLFTEVVRGFSPVFLDTNGDSFPELLVAADFGTSRYYKNQNGTFIDQSDASGTGLDSNGMGTCVGDFNGDGLMDWHVTSIYYDNGVTIGNGNQMYLNQGDDIFIPLEFSSGMMAAGWSWGTAAVDVDHDNLLDIVVTNGWQHGELYIDDPTTVFRNLGANMYEALHNTIGLDHTGQGRGLAKIDYDLDGDIDIVIFSNNESFSLYRNDLSGADTNWAQIRLFTKKNDLLAPFGIGSKIRIFNSNIDLTSSVETGSHYLATSEPMVHFGLGAETEYSLQITWPDGLTSTYTNIPGNHFVEVQRPGLPLFGEVLANWGDLIGPTGLYPCYSGKPGVLSLVAMIDQGYGCDPMLQAGPK